MWICPKCNREFQKINQMHSCKSIPLEEHFKNKDKAKEIYIALEKIVKEKVGDFKVISLPCCIHWFGKYDFIALLPKEDMLEVRLGLNRELKDPKINSTIPTSSKSFKNCIYLKDASEIDDDLIEWINESYNLLEIK